MAGHGNWPGILSNAEPSGRLMVLLLFYFEGETFEYPTNKLVPHDLYCTIFTARPTFTPFKALYSSDMSMLCQLLISRSQRSLRIVAMRKTTFLGFFNYPLLSQCNLPPYCFCPGSAGTGTSEANAAVEGHCCKRDL